MDDVLKMQRIINQINATKTLVEDGKIGNNTELAKTFLKNFFKDIIEKSGFKGLIDTKYESTLNVPYLTQRVDYKYAGRMCNIASLLMVSNYYNNNNVINESDISVLDKKIDTDKELGEWAVKNGLKSFIDRGRLEQLSSVIARVLTEETDHEFQFKYLSIEKIDSLIQNKHPIIVSTQLIGYFTKKSYTGHYVVIIGKIDGGYIIQDPWGFYGTGYSKRTIADIKRKGERVLIPKSILFGNFGVKTQKYDSGSGSNELYRCVAIKN